ncbi:MAG: hypothetical protein WAV05_09815 [Anaerolineales bacterium]
MNTWYILYHLMRADFLERVRRYSFLITLAMTILVGFAFVPPYDARYATGFLFCLMPPQERRCVMYARGVYNSAWIGTVVAFMVINFLSLIGFYLIKNAIESDRGTGVGQIITATPLSKSLYIFGKWLSNLGVLVLMVAVLAVSALFMQLWRGEAIHIDMPVLLTPFLLMVLPVITFTASLAILFEVIPWLQGGMGNIAYFFLWIMMLTTSLGQNLLGYTSLYPTIERDFQAIFPEYRVFSSTGINPVKGDLILIHWGGMHWTSNLIVERLAWIGVAVGVVLAAAFFLRMSDPERNLLHHTEIPATQRYLAQLHELYNHFFLQKVTLPFTRTSDRPAFYPDKVLSPISATLPFHCYFERVVFAELRLMLKGQPWWWWMIGLGMLVVSWVLQGRLALPQHVLPLIGIWPILVWSSMGVRESRYQMQQLIFSAAHSLRRQFSAVWLAGLCVSIATWSGVAFHHLISGNWRGLLVWGAGVLFIPSLALALGAWSGSSKPFEVIYTIIWYCGPVSGLSALDFVSITNASNSIEKFLAYSGCVLVLLGLAILGRRQQLRTL